MGWPHEQIYLLQRRVNEKSVSEKGGAGREEKNKYWQMRHRHCQLKK